MKKWLFSKSGKILGPFAEAEANEFVMANPEAYAWHPSYSHWMAVTCVPEFENAIPAPKPPSIIPKELIEEFVTKEKALIARLDQLDADVATTDNSLLKLDEDIKNFQDITQNCTAEVKATLHSIEQQFANLSKNLSTFKGTVEEEKSEFKEIKAEFNERVENDKKPAVDAPEQSKSVKIPPQIKGDSGKVGSTKIPKIDVVAAQTKKPNVDSGDNKSLSAKLDTQESAKASMDHADVALAEPETIVDETVETQHTETEVNKAPAKVEAKVVKVKSSDEAKKESTFTPKVPPMTTVKKVSSTSKIEFDDKPSSEDVKLASQLKSVDKPVTPPEAESAKPSSTVVGEFDHILYDSLENDSLKVDDESGNKRLRRRRRR